MSKILKCPNCKNKIELNEKIENNQSFICDKCHNEYILNIEKDKYNKDNYILTKKTIFNKWFLLLLIPIIALTIILIIILSNGSNKISYQNKREIYSEQIRILTESLIMNETPDEETNEGTVFKDEIYTVIYKYRNEEKDKDYYLICNEKEEPECGYVLGRDKENKYIEELEYTEPSYVEDINYKKYYELYNSKEPVIVLLSRPGCIHCVHYKPILFRVSDEYKIKIYSLNTNTIDNEKDFNKVWDLANSTGTPTTVIFQNGKIVEKIEGTYTREETIDFFTRNNFIN